MKDTIFLLQNNANLAHYHMIKIVFHVIKMNVCCVIKIWFYCINKNVSKTVVKDITHLMPNVSSAVNIALIALPLTTVLYVKLIISMTLTV